MRAGWPTRRHPCTKICNTSYRQRYVDLLAENFATVLAPEAVIEKIRAHAAVIASVATQDMSQTEYDAAVQELIDFVAARMVAVEEFFAGQE